jgi:hypothetical protein
MTLPPGMTWRGMVSRVLICITIVGLLAWTEIAMATGGVNDAVSRQVQFYSFNHPLPLFLFGALCGHWFIPMQRLPGPGRWNDK